MKIGAVLPAPSGFMPNWVPMPQFVAEGVPAVWTVMRSNFVMTSEAILTEGLERMPEPVAIKRLR